MHYRCVFTLLNWLYTGRIGLGWGHDVFNITHHMLMHFHAYVTYILYILIYWLWLVLFCMFLSPSLSLVTLVASWHLNVSLLCLENSGASTSSNPTPSHVRFCDDKAWQDFSENFSRRGIYSEHQVILLDFSNLDLPTVIHSRGWESLCDVLVTCPSVLIQEFYSNMYGFDYLVPLFVTHVRGTCIMATPDIVSKELCVSMVEHLDHPGYERLRTMSKDKLIFAFCECPSD